jgi:hypothetical protein
MRSESAPHTPRGLEHAGVIDALVHDTKSDEAWLVMIERRAWDGGEAQLFQLQEKLNAYLSFALDGEMAESYPALAGKRSRVILDTTHPPSAAAVEFLDRVREQIGFQGVALEVRITGG